MAVVWADQWKITKKVKKLNVKNFIKNLSINATSFLNVTLLGPYANDAAANTANVQINSLYYDASGNVKIRLT
jgi:hypothetical protein